LYWSGWQYLHTESDVNGPLNLHAGVPNVQGFGFFWRTGIADDDTVPINWSLSAGLGGMGVIPGRDHDTFGIGYFYSNVETERLSNVLGFDDHSDGFEAFYNIAITPAAHLTLDVQVVSSPGPASDTGVILECDWDWCSKPPARSEIDSAINPSIGRGCFESLGMMFSF